MTTTEAAGKLGITPRMVLHLIAIGHLRARKVGRDWQITPAALARVIRRGPGQPKKADSGR